MRLSRTHRKQSGSSLVESALVFMVFMVMMAGLVQLAVIGLAMSSVTYSARRAARFAGLRGSGSGHPATVADVQASARAWAAPLHSAGVGVAVTWTPNNNTGSTVQVVVSYSISPIVLRNPITLRSTARQVITQ